MTVRSGLAKAAADGLTWGLRHIARRPAGNLPGKVACTIDPAIVSELRWKLREGSIVVVGTNGKTTVTNLLADSLESAGRKVLCNRTGANLKSGIASALLQNHQSEWGVIECDELWLAKVVPDLQPTYVLLLNLFRDQLDRCGEIDRIQDAIVSALANSPSTQLVYNADDPLCEFIARRVADERGPSSAKPVTFGISESLDLAQNEVSDATMCQACSHMFSYEYRQYGQLGAYTCHNCGFSRPKLDFFATNVRFGANGISMDVHNSENPAAAVGIHAGLAGSYMAYNLLAVFTAATLAGCSSDAIQQAIDSFDPHNGRLQRYRIDGRNVLLNLAKNPTGFNQNLRIVSADKGPKGVAFFLNDEVVDGHDVSWIWDIDFEELSGHKDIVVFAGGKRSRDLQVRLKYAGIDAALIDSVADAFAKMRREEDLPSDAPLYAIANYSALPPVKRVLDRMESGEGAPASEAKDASSAEATIRERGRWVEKGTDSCVLESPIVIAHILPDLLNLYGDGGNVRILGQRLKWRGIPCEIRQIRYGDAIEFDDVDLVFLGGGPDREQKLATAELAKVKPAFEEYIGQGGPLLAICGGYQILGRTWLLAGEEVPGLGVLDIETRRPGTSADRLVDNIALSSKVAQHPVVGYENHAGRTYLDEGLEPFGKVVSKTGKGNADDAGGMLADGVLAGNILGTYLHGVLLSKNPEVADWLLSKAIERHASRTGEPSISLEQLDDEVELDANSFMAKKLL